MNYEKFISGIQAQAVGANGQEIVKASYLQLGEAVSQVSQAIEALGDATESYKSAYDELGDEDLLEIAHDITNMVRDMATASRSLLDKGYSLLVAR